ncbi:MAG: hypothetical protein AAB631_00940 [Patescibacteria group bacterium]
MDAEQLVQLSWKRYGSGAISFAHNPKNGIGDARGEDFSRVRLGGYAFQVPFQIKTSNNGKTIGLVLPFRGGEEREFAVPRNEKHAQRASRKT